jgi:hypothetical protein
LVDVPIRDLWRNKDDDDDDDPPNVQTGLGAHPASYSMGTWVFVPGDEAAMV